MAINTYFKNIADAIREKTGGSAFITPGQMPLEIRNISGGISPVPVLHVFNEGYVNNSGVFTISSGGNSRCNIYELEQNADYVIIKKDTCRGYCASMFDHDFYGTTEKVSGGSNIFYNGGNTGNIANAVGINTLPNKKYLVISSFVYTGQVNNSDFCVVKFNDFFEV